MVGASVLQRDKLVEINFPLAIVSITWSMPPKCATKLHDRSKGFETFPESGNSHVECFASRKGANVALARWYHLEKLLNVSFKLILNLLLGRLRP